VRIRPWLLAIALAASACGARSSVATPIPTPGTARPIPRSSAASPTPVVLIVMENHSAAEILGASRAPYLHRFAAAGTRFTNMVALTHPSLPNYLAMTAGGTLGCTDDACPPNAYRTPNLFSQLQLAGLRWRAWEESMPGSCVRYDAGAYAVRHDPAVYFRSLRATVCAQRVLPYPARLPAQLPAFTFVTPNLCDDMHGAPGCAATDPIARGDAWLSRHVPPLLARGAVVIVTFDEGAGADQRIYCAMRGPGVPAHGQDGHRYTHLGLLAGLERFFGLGRIRGARTARPLPI